MRSAMETPAPLPPMSQDERRLSAGGSSQARPRGPRKLIYNHSEPIGEWAQNVVSWRRNDGNASDL
jgi:hypothetical protein